MDWSLEELLKRKVYTYVMIAVCGCRVIQNLFMRQKINVLGSYFGD